MLQKPLRTKEEQRNGLSVKINLLPLISTLPRGIFLFYCHGGAKIKNYVRKWQALIKCEKGSKSK